jgi:hypothetical protein
VSDEDTTDAQWAQQEQNERRRREDEGLQRAKVLTDEKKLTDDEHRIAFKQFTQTINEHKGQRNEVFCKSLGRL